MILENLTIENFLGTMFFLPIFIWLGLVLFDGLGAIKDNFYYSSRRR